MAASETAKKTWTILELISWGTTYLSEKGFDDARLNIELLLASVLQLKRIHLYTQFDRPLTEEELARFKELLKRRMTHEPLQYILGETEFFGLKFSVDPRVLIPRPETEILVEEVADKIQVCFEPDEQIRILDVGTGSGCIAVTLAHIFSDARIVAIDVSEEALTLARQNAHRHNVDHNIEFRIANILSHEIHEKFHCIVSNPPYISNEEYEILPEDVKKFEPKQALADGSDGLTFYRAIAQKSNLVMDNGFVAVEHAYNQHEKVLTIFKENGWRNLASVKDYDGNFRVVIAEK